MKYRTVRAAIHRGYFRPSCSLPSRSPLTAAGLQHRYPAEPIIQEPFGAGEEKKTSECSAFVEQQVAMSAALSAASKPLASLAGQRASTTLTPKPRLSSRTVAEHLAAGVQEASQGGVPPNLEPRAPPAAPTPHMASGRAGAGPAAARCCPWHHCQNHPTMGPASTAPAPAKHIPRC